MMPDNTNRAAPLLINEQYCRMMINARWFSTSDPRRGFFMIRRLRARDLFSSAIRTPCDVSIPMHEELSINKLFSSEFIRATPLPTTSVAQQSASR
jgi:hypothetical protein